MKQRFIGALGKLLVVPVMLIACNGSNAPIAKSFKVAFHAKSDDGEPVSDAKFFVDSAEFGTSGADGKLVSTLRRTEGKSVSVNLRCPAGYIDPEQSTALKLTEVHPVNQSGASTLGLTLTCTRKMLDVIVVVRTANAPPLPVDVGGKTLGETDEFGNSHIHLRVERGTRSVSVTLGTLTVPTLRPQNPSRVFELEGKDALVLLEQAFTTERKRSYVRAATTSRSSDKRPVRIGG